MVKYYQEPLDYIFFALSDATRRGIVLELKSGFKTAKELAAPFSISLPAISKHLKVLERAKLLKRKIEGREHYFELQTEAFQAINDWNQFFQEFWNDNLNNLDQFLKTKEKECE